MKKLFALASLWLAITVYLSISLLPFQAMAEESLNTPAVMAVVHGVVIDIEALRGLEFTLQGERCTDEELASIEARGVDVRTPVLDKIGKIILWDETNADDRNATVFSMSTGFGNTATTSLTVNGK